MYCQRKGAKERTVLGRKNGGCLRNNTVIILSDYRTHVLSSCGGEKMKSTEQKD